MSTLFCLQNPSRSRPRHQLRPHPQGRDVTHLTELRRFFVPSRATEFLIISPPKTRLKRSEQKSRSEALFPSLFLVCVAFVTWLLLGRQAAHSFSHLGVKTFLRSRPPCPTFQWGQCKIIIPIYPRVHKNVHPTSKIPQVPDYGTFPLIFCSALYRGLHIEQLPCKQIRMPAGAARRFGVCKVRACKNRGSAHCNSAIK